MGCGWAGATDITPRLDRDQARTWRAWYAHVISSMAAHALLVIAKSVAAKGEPILQQR